MRSIVTGGLGFIGSNLVDRLIDLGHEVLVIDNKSSKSNENYHINEKAQNFHIDLSNKNNFPILKELFVDVDYVFHMAADVSIQYCVENPMESYVNNVNATNYVIEAARLARVKRMVLSSTAALYGAIDKTCIETLSVETLNTYSQSKFASENLMKLYYELYGLKTVSLRYFNAYGPRQPSSGQYAPVIGIFKAQKDANKELTIVGDGQQTRDFVHVSDIVDANIKVAITDVDKYGEVYNVGTGISHSIKTIASMISDKQIHLPPRPAESRFSKANINKIKSTYGWSPKVNLETWIKENL